MSITKTEPLLQSGMTMNQEEFLQRWYAMPKVKYAELINGVVHMPSPVSWSHSSPDDLIATWAGLYAWSTPGVEGGNNPTLNLGNKNVPQPDKILRLTQDCGGTSTLENDLLTGPLELAIEVSVSSLSVDLGEKLKVYESAKVQEYLVVDVNNQTIHWHLLIDDKYQRIEPDDGILKSIVFPGLWLDAAALFTKNTRQLQTVLQAGLASPEHAAFVVRLQAQSK